MADAKRYIGYRDRINQQMNSTVSDGKESYNDTTDQMAISKGQVIEIYHVNTGYSIMFKAFITDFKDDFKTDYKREQVFGRTDPITTYKSTERNISISWKVVAAHAEEAKSNLRKIEQFASMLYATYDSADSSATQMRAGPLFKIKYSNLIVKAGLEEESMMSSAEKSGLAGTIDGFTFSPNLSDETPWFIPGTEGVFPASIDIGIEFHVLHETPLGWDPNGKLRMNAWKDKPAGIDQRQIFYGGKKLTSSGKKIEEERGPVGDPPPPVDPKSIAENLIDAAKSLPGALEAKAKDFLNAQRQEAQLAGKELNAKILGAVEGFKSLF